MQFNELFLKTMSSMGLKKCFGIIGGEAQVNVCRFAQQINAPIICILAAKGAVPDDHPQFLTAANKYLDSVYRSPVLHALFEGVDIAFCGDGGFHSTSQELETLVRYSLPVVIVVLSDSAFGLVKYDQNLNGSASQRHQREFGPVDFTLLANANGVSATKILDIADFPDALEKAFQTHQPHLIEISVKYDYNLLQHIA